MFFNVTQPFQDLFIHFNSSIKKIRIKIRIFLIFIIKHMMTSHATKRQKKDHDGLDNVPLDKHIEVKRKQLVADRENAYTLRERASELRIKMKYMTSRWQWRRQKDLLLEAEVLEKEAETRESMVREHEYEKMVVSYLQTYHQRVEIGVNNNFNSKRRDTIDAYVKQADLTTQRQAALVHEYLAEIGKAPPRVAISVRDDCPCCNTNLLLLQSKSLMTCPDCGYSTTYLDATSQNTSYDDTVEFSIFSYKRVNHFIQWIAHCQGKETYEVPDEILAKVMEDLYKQRITDVNDITQKRVRESLKKLKLRKCYDHVCQITSKISGKRPFRISTETEEILKRMFMKMQPVFEKHAPKSRKNFLSYSYVLYRCFQILGMNHMLEGLTLLKGKEKLALQDEVFLKICKELGWAFNV
jgi:predicted RNA-binding Zn-ribbon protein involved in translation (DUF1610 family)